MPNISSELAKAISDHTYAKGEFQKQVGVVAALKSEKQRKEKRLLEIEVLLAEAEKTRLEAHAKFQEANRRMNAITSKIDRPT
jgi:hypothetical protein